MCTLGLFDEARPLLEQAAGDRFEYVGVNASTRMALVLYADAACWLSDTRAAAILYERLKPFAEQVDWAGSQGYGHVRMSLGLLAACMGEHREADEQLEFACSFHEANNLPIWTARGELGRAEALAARGDASAARNHATRALELSREHGYGVFEPYAATLVETGSPAGA